jgi:hypothetical protein
LSLNSKPLYPTNNESAIVKNTTRILVLKIIFDTVLIHEFFINQLGQKEEFLYRKWLLRISSIHTLKKRV